MVVGPTHMHPCQFVHAQWDWQSLFVGPANKNERDEFVSNENQTNDMKLSLKFNPSYYISVET
jgi:hypothetical protein